MLLIGRMLFPVKETYKNTIAFEPFRLRSEIGIQRLKYFEPLVPR